jgi:L-arginine dehydrogenase
MSQPIVLSEAEITALLPKVNIVAVLERMFRSLAAGNAVR